MSILAANPFVNLDVAQLVSQFKIPGVDVESLMSSQQKNIEALSAANQRVIEGTQALAARQSEILRTTLEETGALVTEALAGGSPQDKALKQAALVKTAFETALNNMKELADLVAKSNNEAAEIITKRVSEGLDELKQAMASAAKK